MTDETVLTTDDAEDAEHVQAMLERAEQLKAGVEDDEAVTEEAAEETEEETDEDSEDVDDANEDEGEEEESSQDDDSGISFDDLTNEYLETGTLSEESFQALEEAGIPREVVEGHIQGLQAMAELTRMKAASAVGGEEQFNSLLQWAGQNLNEKEIDRINSLVAEGDFDGYLLAMQGVQTRYEASFGSNSLNPLAGSQAPSVDIFESQEELKAAMRDPRYQKDEAYRNRVAAKLSRTRRAGIDLA